MRFVMLVEGDTEKHAIAGFLKRWLDPQLSCPVHIQPVNCRGNTRLVRKAQDFLGSPEACEIIAVIGLLDLYGLDIYPPALTTAQERHDWGVKEFERQVSDDKFRMFFAVHEFEAWILGQPGVLPQSVRNTLPANTANPEKVDFGEPPAVLLNRLYMSATRKSYRKTTDGKLLFAKLVPEVVAGKCPYLKGMLDEMFRLAREAGL
jgi:hypothetical protein